MAPIHQPRIRIETCGHLSEAATARKRVDTRNCWIRILFRPLTAGRTPLGVGGVTSGRRLRAAFASSARGPELVARGGDTERARRKGNDDEIAHEQPLWDVFGVLEPMRSASRKVDAEGRSARPVVGVLALAP